MDEIIEKIVNFTKDRDWDQFHSVENLIKSITIESGELLETVQWNGKYNKEEVEMELADVLNYCILLCNKLKVKPEDILLRKLIKNEEKYPVELAKSKSTKYDKLNK